MGDGVRCGNLCICGAGACRICAMVRQCGQNPQKWCDRYGSGRERHGPMAAGWCACMHACVHDCGRELICVFVQQSDPLEWQDRHGSGQVGSKMRNEDAGNVNHRFIVGFSEIVIPLIRLTCKDTPFTWGPDHTKVFKTLKTAFTQAPILVHFNPDNPIVVETDASEYVIAAIISQISPNDGDIHPITFYLCSMQLAELNYKIYNKELLAIFEAF